MQNDFKFQKIDYFFKLFTAAILNDHKMEKKKGKEHTSNIMPLLEMSTFYNLQFIFHKKSTKETL